MRKSKEVRLELTQDLEDKCQLYLSNNRGEPCYECKVCGEKFRDGRQLGGHVSRAHKEKKDAGMGVGRGRRVIRKKNGRREQSWEEELSEEKVKLEEV